MYFSKAKQLSWFCFLKPGSLPAREMQAVLSEIRPFCTRMAAEHQSIAIAEAVSVSEPSMRILHSNLHPCITLQHRLWSRHLVMFSEGHVCWLSSCKSVSKRWGAHRVLGGRGGEEWHSTPLQFGLDLGLLW